MTKEEYTSLVAENIQELTLEEAIERRPALKEKLEALKAACDHAEKYPECTKLDIHHEKILILQRFLDWCEEREPHVMLAKEEELNPGEELTPITGRRLELLIYKYFEIDPVKLETERRTMLDEQRKLN